MEDATKHEEGVVEAVFAILGDPHFTEDHGSHLKIKQGGELASDNPRVNPWAGLNDLIASHALVADAILCPGDIAFQNSAITLSAPPSNLVSCGLLP